MSYRLCISDVLHYKMARDEAQHGTFSEPTRTGIYTTSQGGTVPSWFTVGKRIAWLLVVANPAGVEAQGMVSCRPGIVGVDGDRDGCMALEGTALESRQRPLVKDSKDTRGSSEIVAYTLI